MKSLNGKKGKRERKRDDPLGIRGEILPAWTQRERREVSEECSIGATEDEISGAREQNEDEEDLFFEPDRSGQLTESNKSADIRDSIPGGGSEG